MSTASFDPKTFLIRIKPEILNEFAARHELDFKYNEKSSGSIADEFIKSCERKESEKEALVWIEIHEIDDIASEEGCDYLLNRIIENALPLNRDEYEELSNNKERAMYFFLKFPDIFYSTLDDYNFHQMQGWRGEKVVAKEIKGLMGNIPSLEYGLKTIYSKQYKGDNLKVKYVDKDDRVFFTAYIEDSYTNDLQFDKGDITNKKAKKSVFRLHFLYRPKSGILEIKAKGGQKIIKELQKAFLECFLKEKSSIETTPIRYAFDKIKKIDDLSFPTQAIHNIESVTLKGLRLVHNSSKLKVSIDIGNNKGTDTKPMIESLTKMNLDLHEYEVKQFKIEVKFKKDGRSRQKKVTTAITHPNICDLKERKQDVIIKELLQVWELDTF